MNSLDSSREHLPSPQWLTTAIRRAKPTMTLRVPEPLFLSPDALLATPSSSPCSMLQPLRTPFHFRNTHLLHSLHKAVPRVVCGAPDPLSPFS